MQPTRSSRFALADGTLRRFVFFCLPLVFQLGIASPHSTRADDPIVMEVLPPESVLTGANARQQLIIERVVNGQFRGAIDRPTKWTSSDPTVATVSEFGLVMPVNNGETKITARVELADAILTADCEIQVTGMNQQHRWEFSRDVLPVLSKAGCNAGSCHGALAGKGGFKLSLRGYNPDADHFAITRQARGRRIELSDPGRSLLLAKPSAGLPHKGGLRIDAESDDYRQLAQWITDGAVGPRDTDATLVQLNILPQVATLKLADKQPLLVQATYSDGRQVDVTRWVRFSSTNESVASVSEDGTATIVGYGEGSIVAWFSSQIVLSRLTVPFGGDVDPHAIESAPRRNFIDNLVYDKLAELNFWPSPRSDDNEFLRRVYLDVVGTLPTVAETEAFVTDTQLDKRDRVIEELLSRSEFVDFWSYKWSDVLLVNGRRLRPKAVKAYYGWIREHVGKNTPWDQMVREVVTATGETDANGATNFYSLHQSPEDMTENVCQAFLSLSIGCAKCHNHPLEKWTNDQYYAMASHFARVRAKGWGGDGRNGDGIRTLFLSNDGELMQPTSGKPQPPTPLDGESLAFDAKGDRRAHLAKWITSPENPYFARAAANRIWANFFGIGIVNPIDDMRTSNPATNEPLLSELAEYLVAHDFDLKALMKVILQSETYQRTSKSLPENEADQLFFSRYFPRRLSAEVLLDAIAQVTDVPTEFSQIGFKGADVQSTDDYPLGTRAIQLADSAVVSGFLKTFGRNERDITCECERSNTPSIVQVLHINNGVTINDRLEAEQSCVVKAIAGNEPAKKVIRDAYMKALSRLPNEHEENRLAEMLSEADNDQRREMVEDLYWSILSSREFLFNH